MKALCSLSDATGWYRVFFNYALILICFLSVVLVPHPVVWLIASALMGGRILGIAILNHDAGHLTLFRSKRLNFIVGRWLLGALVLVDFDAYRKGHQQHHVYAGSDKDPDLIFVEHYPVSKASMTRKVVRDLSGLNGIKELLYQFKVSTLQKRLPSIILHAALLGILASFGYGYAYLLFWTGFVFFYPLFSRLRIMGEHGALPDRASRDPRCNTRTTLAGPIERLLIAPNQVYFHLEHHVNPMIPAQNLNAAHQLLRQRGFYDGFDCVASGYWQVMKKCIHDRADERKSSTRRHAPSSVANQS